ncbi:MAG TPA: PIN domain-containing protein [Terriglobales bacterium]|jgi:predicted nucleic acid-binding protein|nr:PIN domain-containing protein [Terriglobales bacterium]
MVTYALDASAVLRYLDDEAGSERVAEIIKSHLDGSCKAIISAIHWGEIAGVTCKTRGRSTMDLVLARLEDFGLDIVPVSAERAVRAALIKVHRRVPYADAFGVELADSFDHVLVTADFDLKPAGKDVKIEFLPSK